MQKKLTLSAQARSNCVIHNLSNDWQEEKRFKVRFKMNCDTKDLEKSATLFHFRPPPPPNRKKTLQIGNVEGPQKPAIRPALGKKRRLSSSDEDDSNLDYLDDLELENDKK